MDLKKLLKEKNLTSRQLSDLCQIPYSTVNDIINGKRNLAKCTAETVWKLAKQLDLSMEELLIQEEKRISFELYKSNLCHALKDKGDISFLTDIITGGDIPRLFERQWYPEGLYLLAMLFLAISKACGLDSMVTTRQSQPSAKQHAEYPTAAPISRIFFGFLIRRRFKRSPSVSRRMMGTCCASAKALSSCRSLFSFL